MNEERFDRLEQQIAALASQTTALADQTTALADQMAKGFATMGREIEELKSDVLGKADRDELLEHIDGIRGFLEDERLERTAMAAELDRHEVWIEAASPKVGISYPIDHASAA